MSALLMIVSRNPQPGIQTLLANNGYRVRASPRVLAQEDDEEAPAAIIADFDEPFTEGPDICRQLRRRYNVPLVAMATGRIVRSGVARCWRRRLRRAAVRHTAAAGKNPAGSPPEQRTHRGRAAQRWRVRNRLPRPSCAGRRTSRASHAERVDLFVPVARRPNAC